MAAMHRAGFTDRSARTLWETRRTYADRDDYLAEISSREGRSILHELDDAELTALVEHLEARLDPGRVVEADRWTLWRAEVV